MAAPRQPPTALDTVLITSMKVGSSTRMDRAAINVDMAVNGTSGAQEY